jgi:ssDNA-binding Zn-finger/Zn-ribbon topoisomerase 1
METTKKCPSCNDGILTIKSGGYGKFWGCSNYRKGCRYTEKLTFKKQDSPMVNNNVDLSHIVLTDQQDAIIKAIAKMDESILVNSGPGCGKSTLLQYAYHTQIKNSGKKVLCTSLGNGSVNDLLLKGIDVTTTVNKITYKIAKQIYPKSRIPTESINGKDTPVKIKNIIMACPLIDEDSRKKNVNPLQQILSYIDGYMLNISMESLEYLEEEGYTLPLEKNQALIDILQYIEDQRLVQRSQFFDFDESVKIALENSELAEKYDIILLDETQDLNKLKQAVIKSWLKPDGIIIAVGDVNQSIMAFTGADKNAMTNVSKLFNCVEYPMNITRRIPQEHVIQYLNPTFPDIQIESVKPGGIFINGLSENLMIDSLAQDKTAFIIARNNSQLVKPAYAMIKAGYNARILGLDIAKKLIDLIIKNKGHNLQVTFENIESYLNKLFKQFETAKNKTWLEDLNENYETIKAIGEGCESIDEILLKIDSLFSDNKADYTFLTGHKSKGLEHKNVYLYGLEKLYKNCKNEKDRIQEYNLHWVMSTRSLDKMVIVS